MATVTIGPFLVNHGQIKLAVPGWEHSGYSLEFSGDKFALNTGLYRQIFSWQPTAIRLEDYFVKVDQIPFKLLPVANPQAVSTPIGTLVSLEALLGSLYVKHEVSRPLTSVLAEFRRHLPINHSFYPRIEAGAKLVSPALAAAGFEVYKFFSYGRTLTVHFGWVYPQDRQVSNAKLHVYAGMIAFKPQPDRTLDQGQWHIPTETMYAYQFTQALESLSRKPPGLLSAAGSKAALDRFKWTKVSLLTPREAKLARVDFVRQHPELHQNHQVLAKALKAAELYSESAEIYAIKKQVPRLIREATEK